MEATPEPQPAAEAAPLPPPVVAAPPLDMKSVLLRRKTKVVTLNEAEHGIDISFTIGKLKTGHYNEIIDAATDADGNENEAVTCALAFVHGVIDPAISEDEANDIDVDILFTVAYEVLVFSGLKEAASKEARKTVPEQ